MFAFIALPLFYEANGHLDVLTIRFNESRRNQYTPISYEYEVYSLNVTPPSREIMTASTLNYLKIWLPSINVITFLPEYYHTHLVFRKKYDS